MGKKENYEKKVNPGIPIPPAVTELIGITDEDVKDAPSFEKIANEVITFIGGCDLGGFNVARFDLPVLRREIYNAGLKFNWENVKVYDAQKVYHLNEKRDLTAAYNFYCNKNHKNAHSALSDALATFEILEAQATRYNESDDSFEKLLRFKYEENAQFSSKHIHNFFLKCYNHF